MRVAARAKPKIPGRAGDVLTLDNPGGVLNTLSNDSPADAICSKVAKEHGMCLADSIVLAALSLNLEIA